MATVRVHEIYLSLQGEGTRAGCPCVFVRLTGCHLRCSYCDTAYAFTGGETRTIDAVREAVLRLAAPYGAGGGASPERLPLVELTGGEPLLQAGALELMERLCDDGFQVLVETSGAVDIGAVDLRVVRIMDLKCPSSGECARNRWENLALLRATDEIKFVIGTEEDYLWMAAQIRERDLASRCPLLVSSVTPLTREQQDDTLRPVPAGQRPMDRRALAERVVADALPVRFQLQLHKFIWPPAQRGV